MKNSFCRICRGRFNLKYPPAAVDSVIKNSTPRTISARIAENGEISENICWDCEETLLGFHKIISDDNEDEEVVVDDDEILFKSLEKSKRKICLSKKTEVIEIDSSDSEDLVIIPEGDNIIDVEAARTIGERIRNQSESVNNHSSRKNTSAKMRNEKEDTSPRGRIFESKQCPLCSYHSGVEFEVVCHIRQTHPQYTAADLRFDALEGDSELTRRIIFAQLWTFFECKECGKIYDRFWPHRKHITTHDRKKIKNTLSLNNNNNNNYNNNKESTNILPKQRNQTKSLKRPLDEIIDSNKTDFGERAKLFKASNDQPPKDLNKTLVVKLHKSEPKNVIDARKKQQSQSEKTKSRALLRKQQQLQARRDRRRQKREEQKMAELLAKKKAAAQSKPTFKMPTQPAPRASSVVRPVVQKFKLNLNCKLCSESFSGLIAFNRHMLRCHSPNEFTKNYKNTPQNICKSCDKQFNDKCRLDWHIRVYHRRKNRKLDVEVNGNDKDEICCQSETTIMAVESKDVNRQDLSKSTNSLSSGSNQMTSLKEPHACASTKSALFCQYCGTLFPPAAETSIMKDHESEHITDGDVKRFLVVTQPAL